MELRNCPRCGKLFGYFNDPVCPECLKADEEELRKIKDYLANHPNAPVPEVVEKTGVSLEKVRNFLRAGRLWLKSAENEAVGAAGAQLTCRSCGTPIASGRFCKNCADALARKLNRGIAGLGPGRPGEMHTWKK